MLYGDRRCMVEDKWGNTWQIATHLGGGAIINNGEQEIRQLVATWMEMKVAFGMNAHSGWAALVALGERDGDLVVADRRRIELVEDEWAR